MTYVSGQTCIRTFIFTSDTSAVGSTSSKCSVQSSIMSHHCWSIGRILIRTFLDNVLEIPSIFCRWGCPCLCSDFKRLCFKASYSVERMDDHDIGHVFRVKWPIKKYVLVWISVFIKHFQCLGKLTFLVALFWAHNYSWITNTFIVMCRNCCGGQIAEVLFQFLGRLYPKQGHADQGNCNFHSKPSFRRIFCPL